MLVHKEMEVFASMKVCDKTNTKKTIWNWETIKKIYTLCLKHNVSGIEKKAVLKGFIFYKDVCLMKYIPNLLRRRL